MDFYRALAARARAVESDRRAADEGPPEDAFSLCARLARFYGGTPKAWLMETPVAIVHASLSALPRLSAEESFLAATRTGVGSGSLPTDTAQQITAEWGQALERAGRAARHRPTASDLAAIGIEMVEVPRV